MELILEIPNYAKVLENEHPVKVYADENLMLKKLLYEISRLDALSEYQLVYNLFNQIARVDIRYKRKENQLFPYLEKHQWYGPSQGMWRFQDDNRELIKKIRIQLESGKLENVKSELDLLVSELSRMIQIEEVKLFPTALEILTHEDWESMKLGEAEIGWMHKTAKNHHPIEGAVVDENITDFIGLLRMNEGRMNLDQINWMLQFMPFDLTYVDENDRVIFYNRGEDRVFPRSAGVIGREVRFCHPPKSVGTVLEILEEFKSGRRNKAEFWIKFKDRVIHIRYFAIRNQKNQYKGVIEVSQDITEIQKLEGERRLLQWE